MIHFISVYNISFRYEQVDIVWLEAAPICLYCHVICTAVGINIRQQSIIILSGYFCFTIFFENTWKIFSIFYLIHFNRFIQMDNGKIYFCVMPYHIYKAIIWCARARESQLLRWIKLKFFFIDVRIQKGLKPLEKKSFYLDIKNHVTAAKLEAKIKELGGVSCISSLLVRCCVRVELVTTFPASFLTAYRFVRAFGVFRASVRILLSLSHSCSFLYLYLSLSISLSLSPFSPLRASPSVPLFPPFSISMPIAAST